jgi:hypothetical protein
MRESGGKPPHSKSDLKVRPESPTPSSSPPYFIASLLLCVIVTAVGAGPVDAPAAAGDRSPDQALGRGAASVMVERGGALVEAAGVPGVAEAEALDIEVMAELVAEGTEEGDEGSDIFADGAFHPHADQRAAGVVVAEELCGGVFADAQRPGGQHADGAAGHAVEVSGGGQELVAGAENAGGGALCHGRLDGGGDGWEAVVGRQRDGVKAIRVEEGLQVIAAGRRVGEHRGSLCSKAKREAKQQGSKEVRRQGN